MADDTQSMDIFGLLSKLFEAIKDMKYLTWIQRIQIILTTGAAGAATWDISKGDIKYVIMASLATFSMHTIAMYQASPTDMKNAAAAESIGKAAQEIVSNKANDEIKKVEVQGDAEIKKAQTEPPKTDSLDSYINDMEKK